MEIDISDPVGMMHKVCDEFKALRARCERLEGALKNICSADVERLVEAARDVTSWVWFEILRYADCDSAEIQVDIQKLEAALEPFNK